MKKFLPFILTTSAFFCLFFLKIDHVLAITDAATHYTSVTASEEKTECDPNTVTSQTSRPAYCNLCVDWKDETKTSSCATPFTVYKEQTFAKTGPATIPFENIWFTVDPTSTTIPFVGLNGFESENNYLADYFEGTNEYYRNYGDQTTLTSYQGILRKLTPYEYQNQLKKQLIARIPTPSEPGVAFEENQIHNYQVKYVGRLCWDVPFWMDASRLVFKEIVNLVTNNVFVDTLNTLKDKLINAPIAWINNKFDTEIKSIPDADIQIDLKIANFGHYCIYEEKGAGWLLVKSLNLLNSIPGLGELQEILTYVSQEIPGLIHFSSTENLETIEEPLSAIAKHMPPEPNSENYKEELLTWKKSGPESYPPHSKGYWYRLWQAVPMVSREDERGEIKASVEEPNEIVIDRENDDRQVEKVPHLARLYEASKIINQLLIPKTSDETEDQTEIANTDNSPIACFKENYLPANGEGDRLCCDAEINAQLAGEFENPYYEECNVELGKLKSKCANLKGGMNTSTPISKELKETIDNCDKEVNELMAECGTATEEISQEVEMNLTHPYLALIWQNTAKPDSGLFNIFRPNGTPVFEDMDAASTIKYSSTEAEVAVSPSEGLFYYPHLGGVQKAKEQVVNQTLWPYKKQ